MGKIRENRFRIHPTVFKKAPDDENSNNKAGNVVDDVKTSCSLSETPHDSSCNLFSGINININNITTSLNRDFDIATVSGKSRRELKKEAQSLPKKEKLRRRHEAFMQKLDQYYTMKKQKLKLKAKSKKQGPKLDDMAPLLQSLLNDIPELPTKTRVKKNISRASMKTNKRLKEHMMDVKHFQKVLNDSVFRRNPAVAITEYLKQKVKDQRPDLHLE